MTAKSPATDVSRSLYPFVLAGFTSLLLISNVAAVKLIALTLPGDRVVTVDGGALLFPLVYILGDVLAEVYGWAAAKRAVWSGFIVSALASLTFWLVQISPASPSWQNQEAFTAVLGFVPRIVIASLCGFLIGQLLNSYVLVWVKEKFVDRRLWVRLIGSTVVGEFADTLVFCTIAFYGVITGEEFFGYVAFGYVWKTLLEVILLPITYRVIAIVKQRENLA